MSIRRVSCLILVLLLVGVSQADIHQQSNAIAPAAGMIQTQASHARDRSDIDPSAPGVSGSDLRPEQTPQDPNIPPEEGRNWVLAQGIQYGDEQLSPLCYYDSRKVAAEGEDFFVAAWETGAANDNEVMASLWDIFFGLWTNPEPVSESYSDAGRVDLAVGSDGTIHACWHQNYTASQTTYEVYYAQLPSGALTWTDPVMVSTQDATESNFPLVCVDNEDYVTVKWAELLRNPQSGAILEFQGYQVNTSTDGGQTWDAGNIRWATQDTLLIYGPMCCDPVSGDIYLVETSSNNDPSDGYYDLLVYHYDKSTDTWEDAEILMYGGSEGPYYDMYHSSCAVGPDGTVHILNSQTTGNGAGTYVALLGFGVPFHSRLLHFYGTSGNWTGPEEVYPGTDGIYEGHEGVYPDSTFAYLSGWSQIGLDADNVLYIGTQAFAEYYNGSYISGEDDMHWGDSNWEAEAFIGAKDLNRDGEWVWTRASDINLRPDSIAIKYTKLTENVSPSGPGIVWDETYDGGPPQRVLFTRLVDFTAPGAVSNLQASRPEANGPITLTWENPEDEDLAGVLIARDTVGAAEFVGLRRGISPIDADGNFLFNDLWVVEADTITGVIEPIFEDDTAPEGTVYYTVVPYDTHLHHYYPIDEELAVIQVDSIAVSGDVANILPTALQLEAVIPNPVVATAEISYTVPEAGAIRIAVYDVSGRCVSTIYEGNATAGAGAVRWDATDEHGSSLGSGVYLCRIEQGEMATSRHLVVLQ